MRWTDEWSLEIGPFQERLDHLADHLVKELPEGSWQIARFIKACFISDLRCATVESVARRIRIPARTLTNRCQRLAVLSPHEILAICKCMAAGRAICRGASIADSAFAYGCARPKTLRCAFKRFFGFTPNQLLKRGQPRRIVLPRTLIRGAAVGSWILIFGAAAGEAQRSDSLSATLTGTVTETLSRTPLTAATITIEGLTIRATSGSDGRYRLVGVPPGPQVIRAISVGYAPFRRPIIVPAHGVLIVDLVLGKSALNLPNLTVTADPGGRAGGELGTASVIESEAIRNQIAASLAGILELVPGSVLQPPGLDGVQQFGLRSVPVSPGASGASASSPNAGVLASFGTQIVLDGIPLSNNANLQSLGARGELSFASTAGGGIDLRRLPASTIERVEVIRGIPSVRFGDLTQGVVLVDTRAGAVHPELRLRLDPRTAEVTAIGGLNLGRTQTGTANLDLTRTRLAPGFRDNTGSRIAFQAAHRFATGTVSIDSRVDGFQVLEDEPETEAAPNMAARSRDNGIRFSERIRWNSGTASKVEWTAAFEAGRQRSFTKSPRLMGAMPFTDRLVEGTQDGRFIGGEYVASVNVDGDPRFLYSRLEWSGGVTMEGLRNNLRLGSELRREWSSGPGVQFDIAFPPQVTFNGVQGYDRPRAFDSVPPLVTTGLYVDDRLAGFVRGVRWALQAGLRLDFLHRGQSWFSGTRDQVLAPRVQAEIAPAERLRIRIGAGRVAKVPALGDLFPAVQYYDLINFNWYANDPAERRAIITTRILDRANSELEMVRTDKAEAGVEFAFGNGGELSLVGYREHTDNAVGVDAALTHLIRERLAVDSSTIGMARPPAVLEPAIARDTIPTLIDRPANNVQVRTSGLELTALVPDLEPLHLRFAIQGAWARTRLHSGGIELASGFSGFQLSPTAQRTPYWEATTRTGERMILTTRLIHQQPDAGLVITGTLQYTLRENRQDLGGSDTLSFAGYVTRAGDLVPVPFEARGRTEFADLRVARNGLFNQQQSPADWLFSLQVSKTMPLGGRLSFYAFNAFDRVGHYATQTVSPRLFPAARFGLELTLPLPSGT